MGAIFLNAQGIKREFYRPDKVILSSFFIKECKSVLESFSIDDFNLFRCK